MGTQLSIKRYALQKLHQHILDGEPLARHQYVLRTQNGNCHYCAVGFLMNACGLVLEDIESDDHLNGRAIHTGSFEKEIKALEGFGFSLAELKLIQNYNDNLEYDQMVRLIEMRLVHC